VIPAIGGAAEAVALRDNVEEDEEALFNTDVGGELRLDVVEDPISEVDKGDLVHVAEVVEAVGNSHEQIYGTLRAARFLDGGHGAIGVGGQKLRSRSKSKCQWRGNAELSGETPESGDAREMNGVDATRR
jgi:hypothetical protein